MPSSHFLTITWTRERTAALSDVSSNELHCFNSIVVNLMKEGSEWVICERGSNHPLFITSITSKEIGEKERERRRVWQSNKRLTQNWMLHKQRDGITASPRAAFGIRLLCAYDYDSLQFSKHTPRTDTSHTHGAIPDTCSCGSSSLFYTRSAWWAREHTHHAMREECAQPSSLLPWQSSWLWIKGRR